MYPWALFCCVLLAPIPLLAEQVPVRYTEGLLHGFLSLLSVDGKRIADGESSQTVKGERVSSHLTFRFKDGSLYEETTEFSEHGVFRLLSDRVIERGPSFSHPTDTVLDASTGQITVRYTDKNGQQGVLSERQDLPADVANGLLLTLLKDIEPSTPKTTVSMVVATPKPRLVNLEIVPQGREEIRSGSISHQTVRYDVKVKILGVAGIVAPLIGKQPPDMHVWILSGAAPAFVKFEGPLYQGGPIWQAQIAPVEFAATRQRQ